MRRSRWTCALLVLLALAPLSGCVVSQVSMEIPSFGDGDVDGIWLWRLSSTTNQYERDCRITLSSPDVDLKGKEFVSYTQQCSSHGDVNLGAYIHRSPSDPNTITLVLWYTRWQSTPGSYKASAYNGAGESALSATAVTL